MASFCLKKRESNETVTQAPSDSLMGCLFNPLNSFKSSFLFVKQLTAIVISTIVYTRCLLEQGDFADKDLDGTAVKIIAGRPKSTSAARSLVKWTEGAFDAIERRYLRMLIFEIKNEHAKEAEIYQLKFFYNEGSTECTVDGGVIPFRYSGNIEKIGHDVRNLVRNIFVSSSLYNALTDDSVVTMTLLYYDGTPQEYEPPGFSPCHGPQPMEDDNNKRPLTLGSVATPYHRVAVSTYMNRG